MFNSSSNCSNAERFNGDDEDEEMEILATGTTPSRTSSLNK
jgi:hypothetical protein